jgi:purine-binding chemotaxis protein CheW
LDKGSEDQEGTLMVAGEVTRTSTHLLLVSVGQRAAAFFVESVAEIVQMVAIEPLPEAPQWVQGIVNVRGTPVPVVDLRTRFGLEFRPYGLDTPMIICRQSQRLVAMVTDAVEGVIAPADDDFSSPDEVLGAEHPLACVVRWGSRIVPVLDIDRVCAGTETLDLPELDGRAA